ncbi:pre-mRNA-splicing factor SYF2 [Sarcophilus harrisii]
MATRAAAALDGTFPTHAQLVNYCCACAKSSPLPPLPPSSGAFSTFASGGASRGSGRSSQEIRHWRKSLAPDVLGVTSLFLPEVIRAAERLAAMASGVETETRPETLEEEEEERPLTAAEALAAQKREERLRKFRELHMKRNEARKLNHQEVVEEDKRLKLPANWEAKKARLEWELQVEEKKKECAARGEDYERVKLLEISAEDAERWERKKKRKNPDLGFSDYAAAQLRQYHRLTKQIKPDMEAYEKLREKYGEEFYPTSNSLLHGTHVPSTEEIDRMVIDLDKQIEKREKYSRRRPYNDDSDIDYINERNAKFNKKAERFYGKYTAEIKQNLERGTAV